LRGIALTVLAIVGALLVFGSIFYIVYTTQIAAETNAVKDRIGLNWDNQEAPFVPPFYLSITKPLLKGAYLDIAVGFWKPEQLQNWKRKLDSAGLGRHIEPQHFVASKFWLTLIVGTLMLMNYLFNTDPGPWWFPFMAIGLAFFIPNLHVKQLRDLRHQSIRITMPYVMDLLTLSMEAGKEFQGAVSKVVERSPRSPFIDELTELLKDIQLGKSRAESMRKMADRIDLPEITSLVAILVSTDQMGVSIGNVLRAQAETLRTERLVRAEKMGAAASQKILIPLVVFILPSVFLIIFGPIILSFLGVR
jgi:tight adherence protein C